MIGFNERNEFGIRFDCLFTKHRKRKMDVAREFGCDSATLSNYIYARKSPSVERFMEICNIIGATDEEILYCLKAFREDAV